MIPHNVRWSLFARNDRVLVAVSGGPDSLCLLHLLWTERKSRGLRAVEAAHLDHGLRGNESAAEAAWVAAWCAERGIPCHVGQADVAALARGTKRSKQEAARTARYAFLEETAAERGATKIATGHTRDDQVETILMNVLRGTGLDGLRGIPARRGPFVRPLLDVSRAEIEDYCAAHRLEPRHDPSNLSSNSYTRNRVRLDLLPQLAREYNPAVGAALLRLSEIAARDMDYVQTQAEAALAEATRERDGFRLVLDRPTLAGLHPALLRHVLRRAISGLKGTGEGVPYDHIEEICRAVAAHTADTFHLNLPNPHGAVRITDKTLILTQVDASAPQTSVALTAPGQATLPGTDWTVFADFDPLADAITLDAASVCLDTLALRNWRQGDRVDPLGLGGRHKKLSDIFTDAKVPRSDRHHVPIITDARGIVWIVGHCIAERVKVTPETKRRLYLAAERSEPLPDRSSPPSPKGRG